MARMLLIVCLIGFYKWILLAVLLINIIDFMKLLKKECHNNYEFLTWEYGKHHIKNRIWVNYTLARLRWEVILNTVTEKIPALSV